MTGKGKIPWNKGLTKEDNEIIKVSSEKCSETKKRLYKEGEIKTWNKGKHYSLGIHRTKKQKDHLSKLNSGTNHPFFGCHHTKESKRKISKAAILSNNNPVNKKKQSERIRGKNNMAHLPGVRKKCSKRMRLQNLKRIESQQKDGLPLIPAIGNNETEILDQLEYDFKRPIERQKRMIGYFLDGYIPELNLAIEIDEDWHNNRKERDAIRQKEIEEELGCNFLRIKDFKSTAMLEDG